MVRDVPGFGRGTDEEGRPRRIARQRGVAVGIHTEFHAERDRIGEVVDVHRIAGDQAIEPKSLHDVVRAGLVDQQPPGWISRGNDRWLSRGRRIRGGCRQSACAESRGQTDPGGADQITSIHVVNPLSIRPNMIPPLRGAKANVRQDLDRNAEVARRSEGVAAELQGEQLPVRPTPRRGARRHSPAVHV